MAAVTRYGKDEEYLCKRVQKSDKSGDKVTRAVARDKKGLSQICQWYIYLLADLKIVYLNAHMFIVLIVDVSFQVIFHVIQLSHVKNCCRSHLMLKVHKTYPSAHVMTQIVPGRVFCMSRATMLHCTCRVSRKRSLRDAHAHTHDYFLAARLTSCFCALVIMAG